MITSAEYCSFKIRYRVMLVEETCPPDGMSGLWHRYVIGVDEARIEGRKPGSLTDVEKHAELMVEGLNERVNNPSASAYGRRRIRK
ncbi:MAG: hypothetical protein HY272_01435 [Gammaproteobacteria bacterium]|nr:hypothetical protein [Gammaproteobacteria bacterium]